VRLAGRELGKKGGMEAAVSVSYGAYTGGFDAGTTATIARRLGATELRARTRGRNSAAEEKRVEAATDAWAWVEGRGAAYYDQVQSVVLHQIHRRFPKLEQAAWKNCLHGGCRGVRDRNAPRRRRTVANGRARRPPPPERR